MQTPDGQTTLAAAKLTSKLLCCKCSRLQKALAQLHRIFGSPGLICLGRLRLLKLSALEE